MIAEKTITVDGSAYTVTLSDEKKALLTAYAAGRAIIRILVPREAESGEDAPETVSSDLESDSPWDPALYAVEREEDADEFLLERAVRRRYGLPFVIGETRRLIIREFVPADLGDLQAFEEGETEGILDTEDGLLCYIRGQYIFYQYGLWAVTEKESGQLLGKAGIYNLKWDGQEDLAVSSDLPLLELGYHIAPPFRRRGYGEEACRGILEYAGEHLKGQIYAKIDSRNQESIHLAEKLGFTLTAHRCSVAEQCCYLYSRYC